MKKVKKFHILMFGALIGVINGFFGGGGGMIVVPLLTKMFGMEQKEAQATALFIILPISVVSTVVYICYNSISWAVGWPVILGVVLGGIIGAFALNKIKNRALAWIFSIFMLVGGIMLLFR